MIQNDIKSIYPKEIEENELIKDEFYPKEINIETFFLEVLEESDGEVEEQSFNYYPQDLKKINLRLKDLEIKKLFKPRKTSPSKMRKPLLSNLNNTRLQKPAFCPTISSNQSSITWREIENNTKDYSVEPTIDISYDLNEKIKIKIKKLARLVLNTPYGSYINSKIIEVAEFLIDKELLREDFDSDKNKDRNEWFLDSYSKREGEFIRKIWFSQMRTEERHILFFDWFDKYYIQGLEEASPEIQKTIIKRMMAESWKNYRSSKAELSQVQNERSKSLTKVSTNNFVQIPKVETYSDRISECLDQVEE